MVTVISLVNNSQDDLILQEMILKSQEISLICNLPCVALRTWTAKVKNKDTAGGKKKGGEVKKNKKRPKQIHP